MSHLLSRILGNITTRIMFIIYVLLIVITTFFIIFGYYNQLDLQEKRQHDKLTAIVTSLALGIDGSEHERMMSEHPNDGDIKTVEENMVYRDINQMMNQAVIENGLDDPMYTLVYNEERDVFHYGVRSDDQVYYRDDYVEYPKILKDSMEVGGQIPLYKTENGEWLSAFHPIRNFDGEVVAILEADINFAKFKDIVFNQYKKQAIISLIVIAVLAIILIPYALKILRADEKQKRLFMMQKQLIEEKNKDITDSINYALKIQNAILPQVTKLDQLFKDNFVFYKSKDIVAGDFYWMEQKGDDVYIAVADCTGHGVPGAMVSMICSNALNRVVNELGITNTGEILDRTTDIVISRFEAGSEDIKDGMDICFCRINLKTKELQFSGANNPLYLLRNGEIEIYKGCKQPIGKYAERKEFECANISLQEGDRIYMFTDGFADQFGGENGKKLKYKPFQKILVSGKDLPLKRQKDELTQLFLNWMGDFEQVDDVCVIGIEF